MRKGNLPRKERGMIVWMGILLLSVFTFWSNAGELNYIIDESNTLKPKDRQNIEMLLSENRGLNAEVILMYSQAETLPSKEEMHQKVQQNIRRYGYGMKGRTENGAIFFFLNQIPLGQTTCHIIVTGEQQKIFGIRQLQDITLSLEEQAKQNNKPDVLVAELLTACNRYLYPIINELPSEQLSEMEIRKASVAIRRLQSEYEMDIVMLLKPEISYDKYQQYLENYFPEQGYGQGQDKSGFFLLYDQNTQQCDFRFFGKARTKWENQDFTALQFRLKEKIVKLDLQGTIKALELWLNPKSAEREEAIAENDQAEYFGKYIMDSENVFPKTLKNDLEYRAYKMDRKYDIAYVIYFLPKDFNDRVEEVIDLYYQRHLAPKTAAILTIHPLQGVKDFRLYGESLISEAETKKMNKALRMVKYNLRDFEENDMEAVASFYLNGMDFLSSVLDANLNRSSICNIDEIAVSSEQIAAWDLKLDEIRGDQFRVAVFLKDGISGQGGSRNWSSFMEDAFRYYDDKMHTLIALFFQNRQEVILTWSNYDYAVKDILNKEWKPEMDAIAANRAEGDLWEVFFQKMTQLTQLPQVQVKEQPLSQLNTEGFFFSRIAVLGIGFVGVLLVILLIRRKIVLKTSKRMTRKSYSEVYDQKEERMRQAEEEEYNKRYEEE